MKCCCRWGAALAGEYPEFPCAECERHDDEYNDRGWECRRHRRERLHAEPLDVEGTVADLLLLREEFTG